MTISTTSSSITVAGDGLNSSFTFPFVADSASNIIVQYIDADGVQTTLNPSQYTLVINAAGPNQLWGQGGTITYPLVGSPIAAGTYLLIQRLLPQTQEITVRNQGNYYAQVTEQALDILEMQLQQVSARTGQLRGVWVTATDYNFGDIVQDGVNGNNTDNYYTCIIANTSDVWADDLAAGYWSLSFNVQQVEEYADEAAASAAAALASQVAAASSASSASTSASTATTQAGNAAVSAAAALASETAAANYAASYSGTSTTSLAIGTGAKIFTTQASKLWVNGQFLQIASDADAANYMHGTVTSYSGTTLTMNITDIGGSGTFADWNISISGTQGPAGPSGSGSVTSVAMTGDNVIFNTAVTGSPVTTTGTLIPVLKTQTANMVLAGPTTGAAATPTFRAVVAADIPANTVALASLQNQAASTVVMNATSGSAAPTAVALAASQLLGRGATGDGGAITLGTNLSMSGTTLNASGAGTLTSYTPTVAASAGTITTSSSTGWYQLISPNLCYFTARAVITTNGTGSGTLRIGTPFPVVTNFNTVCGLEGSVTGATVTGVTVVGQQYCNVLLYDGTYPAADGRSITISGFMQYA